MFHSRKVQLFIACVVTLSTGSMFALQSINPLALRSVVAASDAVTTMNLFLVPIACGLGGAAALSLNSKQEMLLAYPNRGRLHVILRAIFSITMILVAAQLVTLTVAVGLASHEGSSISARAFFQVPISILHLLAATSFGVGIGSLFPHFLIPPLLTSAVWSAGAFNILGLDSAYSYTSRVLTEIGTDVLTSTGYLTFLLLFGSLFFSGLLLALSEVLQIKSVLWIAVVLIAAYAAQTNVLSTVPLYERTSGRTECVDLGNHQLTRLCVPTDQAYRIGEFSQRISPTVGKLEELSSNKEARVLTLGMNLSAESLLDPDSTTPSIVDSVISSYSQCIQEWNDQTNPRPLEEPVMEVELSLREILVNWSLGEHGVTNAEASQAFSLLIHCPPEQP